VAVDASEEAPHINFNRVVVVHTPAVIQGSWSNPQQQNERTNHRGLMTFVVIEIQDGCPTDRSALFIIIEKQLSSSWDFNQQSSSSWL
jgi:hypothetical protein